LHNKPKRSVLLTGIRSISSLEKAHLHPR